MKIRNGNFTLYNGQICYLFELRQESSVNQYELEYQICCLPKEAKSFVGFHEHLSKELFCKFFNFSEINNAFFINTLDHYNGTRVKVFEYNHEPESVYITTTEEDKIALKDFVNMGNYFAKVVKIHELDKIWEERGKSDYNFPMPQFIDTYLELSSQSLTSGE